jgi:chromosome segregation ATPase
MLVQQLPPQPDKTEIVQHCSSIAQSNLGSPNLKHFLKRIDSDTGKHQIILVVENKCPSIVIAEEDIKRWLIDLGDFASSLDIGQKQLALSLTKLDGDCAEILNYFNSRLTDTEELANLINDDQLKMQSQLHQLRSQLDDYDDQFVELLDNESKTKSSLEAIQLIIDQRVSALEEKFSAINSAHESKKTSSFEEHNTTTPSSLTSEIAQHMANQAAIAKRLDVLEDQSKQLVSLEQSSIQAKAEKESHRTTKLQQINHLQRRVAVLTWLGGGSIVSFFLACAWWLYVHKK